jgi:serine/threonine protein phosphatase 1
MRTLAIGDIHGCSRALNGLLDMVHPGPDDLVVTLGDYVDRGPDSRGVLDRLLGLPARCRHVALRGNHDQMMLDARTDLDALRDWLQCGGRETLQSYGTAGKEGMLADVPVEHWDFLESVCVPYFETDTHLFVHANLYPDLPLAEQPTYMLYWEKLHDAGPHVSGKTVVVGHTAQKSGVPLDLGHAVCIDTFVYGSGWLTCLDVATGELWQASEDGRRRTGWLGEDFQAPG